MKRTGFVSAAIAAFFLVGEMSGGVSAHPGNVGKDGCHVQKSNGQRHCHPERVNRAGPGKPKAVTPRDTPPKDTPAKPVLPATGSDTKAPPPVQPQQPQPQQ